MFTRLLLKLARPAPSLKKHAVARRLLNTARYPLKTRYRHATAYNTEKDSSTVKDPMSHRNTEAMLQYYAMYRATFANIFVANIFASPFWKRFAKFFGRKFATYSIISVWMHLLHMLLLSGIQQHGQCFSS